MEGLARRFWQGNETHRGVPGAPGRVATLVEEREAVTHGIAMELKGEEALDYLNNRYQATYLPSFTETNDLMYVLFSSRYVRRV